MTERESLTELAAIKTMQRFMLYLVIPYLGSEVFGLQKKKRVSFVECMQESLGENECSYTTK
jgi:hypothetical protein